MGNRREDEHVFPFLMLRIETLKDGRNLEDSVAQWGILNSNQLLDCDWQWVGSFWAMLRLVNDVSVWWLTSVSFQVDTIWRRVQELGKFFIPFWHFSAQAHFSASFFVYTCLSGVTPKRLVRARRGPLRPDADPPTRQFQSEPDSWESPLVSVYWDDYYQTLLKFHLVSYWLV